MWEKEKPAIGKKKTRIARMSTKVLYVVTSGCYSDYSIVAIFDDKALAEALVGEDDDRDGYGRRIEEYPLNQHEENIRAGLQTHTVGLLRNGDLHCYSASYGRDVQPDSLEFYFSPLNGEKFYYFEAHILAKTKEQAIKAANERRAMWIANGNKWPEPVA
jgi:hypothetical protein